jgi:hypothetical protein
MQEETLRRERWDEVEGSGGVQLPPTPQEQPFPFVEPPHERNEEKDDEDDDERPEPPAPPLQRRVLPVIAQVRAENAAERQQREKLAKVISRDRAAKSGKSEKAEPRAEGQAEAKAQPKLAAVPAAVPTPKHNLGLFSDMANVREKLDRSRAANGESGVHFLDVKMGMCTFPLWKGHERFEEKRVCGCKAVTGKSWCPSHYQIVFDPMKNR